MLNKILELLEQWNIKKKIIEQKNKTIFIKEQDILFISMGKNIGYE